MSDLPNGFTGFAKPEIYFWVSYSIALICLFFCQYHTVLITRAVN